MKRIVMRGVLALALLVMLVSSSVDLPRLGHAMRARSAGTLALTVASGPPSSVVGVSAPAGTFNSGETIMLQFQDASSNSVTYPNRTATSTGALSQVDEIVPSSAAIGVGTFTATGGTSGTTATASFTVYKVLPGTPNVTPASAPAGKDIMVTDTGYTRNGAITITIGGVQAGIVSGGTADATGAVHATVTVPPLPVGSATIVVTDSTTGLSGTLTNGFSITPLPAITVHGLLVQTPINTALSGVTIGTYADSQDLTVGSYTASIDWGDGTAGSTGGVQPGGTAGQYSITGSHTYTSAGVFPIDVTIQASDGRTAYLSSNADVATSGQALQYLLSAGWNLLAPQATAGTMQASAVLLAFLNASGGQLAAIYGLSANRWTPSLIQPAGKPAIGNDFTLTLGQGYLVYCDKQAVVTLSAAAPAGAGRVIRTGLGPTQRAQLPPLPSLP